jgi:hypothetical protein
VAAAATSPAAIQRLEVWVDGQKVQQVYAASIDVSLTLAVGTRKLTVQAVDSTGTYKSTRYVAVVSDGVTITAPTTTSTTSPARVAASANASSGIKLMQIYVDGKKVEDVRASSLDKYIPMAAGTRRLTVQAYDNNGNIMKQSKTITVK